MIGKKYDAHEADTLLLVAGENLTQQHSEGRRAVLFQLVFLSQALMVAIVVVGGPWLEARCPPELLDHYPSSIA